MFLLEEEIYTSHLKNLSRYLGYVTCGIRAQVATLGPLWADRKLEGTSWIK